MSLKGLYNIFADFILIIITVQQIKKDSSGLERVKFLMGLSHSLKCILMIYIYVYILSFMLSQVGFILDLQIALIYKTILCLQLFAALAFLFFFQFPGQEKESEKKPLLWQLVARAKNFSSSC